MMYVDPELILMDKNGVCFLDPFRLHFCHAWKRSLRFYSHSLNRFIP
jgi:hypothetical protein